MKYLKFVIAWFFVGVGAATALLTVWLKFTDLNSIQFVNVVTTIFWPTSRTIGSWVGRPDELKLTLIYAEAVVANGFLYATIALAFRYIAHRYRSGTLSS